MKKILIINNNLHIGGVQKALVSLLWNIRHRYEVTLLLFHDQGEYSHELPPEVKVISTTSGYRYLGMTRQDLATGKDRLARAFYAAVSRLLGRKYAIAIMKPGQQPLEGYDAAVSFLHNSKEKSFYGGCNEFLLNHVSAKKKVAFLHCDYMRSGANTPENNRMYARFDAIAACSQGCADSFLKINPELADRVMVVPNCHRFDRIRELACSAPVKLDPQKINILTVSRFGREKGVERALQVIGGLGSLKDRIHFYIIGDGAQRPLVLETLEKEQLQSCVTLCGKQENPYGYIKAADLLLIPSRSEAAPLVIGEAACLGTPVLSMKTSSALEMIRDTGFGWVCENQVDAMTEALAELIRQPERLTTVREVLLRTDFQNEPAVARFSECID